MASKYAIETIFRLVDKVTGPLNKVSGQGKIVGDRLKKAFHEADKRVAAFGKSVTKVIPTLSKAGLAAASAFTVKGVKDAIEFQTALAKAGTIADTARVPLSALSADILALSTKMGVGANEIAESTYQAISAGVSTEKALLAVEAATKAGIAGFTDTATAIDGLTSVLNAYGLQTEKITDISDQMLIAQNLGKTSFGDMASAMGQVIPTAAAMNVKTEELFASIASLTSNAIPTSSAMTSLKAALSNVMKPGDKAVKMAKALGLEFNAAALQSKGLAAFLEDVKNKTGGNQAVLSQLFRSTEAVNAINVLIGSGSALFEKALGDMRDSAGATEEAFGKMMDTPAKRWAKAMNSLKNAGIQLGTSLFPVVEEGVAKIAAVIDSINVDKLSEQFRAAGKIALGLLDILVKAGPAIAAISAATFLYKRGMDALVIVSGVYNGVAMITNSIQTAYRSVVLGSAAATSAMSFQTGAAAAVTGIFTEVFKARNKALLKGNILTGIAIGLQGALNAVMSANPVVLIVMAVIAAVALLVAGIVLLVKNWEKVKEAFVIAGIWIKTFFEDFGNRVRGLWESVAGFFKTVCARISDFFKNLWIGITDVAARAAGWFSNVWSGVAETFASAWNWASNFFTSIWEGFKNAISNFIEWLTPVVNFIIAPFVAIGNAIGFVIDKVDGWIDKNAKKANAAVAAYKDAKKAGEGAGVKAVETATGAGVIKVPAGFAAPVFDLSGFDGSAGSAMSGTGGKSKIHGVYDISGAAPALGGGSGSRFPGGMADAARSAVDTAVQSILTLVRSIDGNIARIAAWTFAPEGALVPAPVTQGERTAYSLQERRETAVIELRAAQGTEAEIIRAAPETNIRLIRSGGLL
jgi:TP901 family phage tail tape measure protein